MKKIISLLISTLLLLGSMTIFAYAEEIKYSDCENGKVVFNEIPENATELSDVLNDNNSKNIKLLAGTYTVSKSYELSRLPVAPFVGGGIGISGDVHIIINDGVTLTVNGGFMNNGTGRLFIHGVSGGNCKVIINGKVYEKKILSGIENYALGQGVELDELNVIDCFVTINGAKGLQGIAPLDASGKSGYNAVNKTAITLYGGNLLINGGEGGDSSSKKGFNNPNNGGDGAFALSECKVFVKGGKLELHGGKGGKSLRSTKNGKDSAAIDYATDIDQKNVKFKTCSSETIDNYSSVKRCNDFIVEATSFNILLASVIDNINEPWALLIIAAVIIAAVTTIVIVTKKKKKNISVKS